MTEEVVSLSLGGGQPRKVWYVCFPFRLIRSEIWSGSGMTGLLGKLLSWISVPLSCSGVRSIMHPYRCDWLEALK